MNRNITGAFAGVVMVVIVLVLIGLAVWGVVWLVAGPESPTPEESIPILDNNEMIQLVQVLDHDTDYSVYRLSDFKTGARCIIVLNNFLGTSSISCIPGPAG